MATPKSKTFRIDLQKKGQVTLPMEIRRQLPDDVSFKVTILMSGKILLDPVETRSIADNWFHSPEWQERHDAALADEAAGRVTSVPVGEASDALEKLRAG